MIPVKDNIYQLHFVASGLDSSELNYSGPGTFTGESTQDEEGVSLFLFEKLSVDKGFTQQGWFSEEDIVRKL